MSSPQHPSSPVLSVYAHPDDETFGVAGTLAALRRRESPVTLVCATRGEAGGISDPALATPETLGTVREQELRTAMGIVGVDDIRLLGYRDSGMEGTPENDDPRALAQASEPAVAAEIAAIIREVRPVAVVTFGPDGVYGHPDHLVVHRATTAAVHLAAEASPTSPGWQTPALYYQTTSRERMVERAAHRKGPFAEMSPERLLNLGTPRADISFALDVRPFLDEKERAMRAHRTQIGPDGPMSELPREEVLNMLSKEHYVHVSLPWEPTAGAADPIAALAAEIGAPPA